MVDVQLSRPRTAGGRGGRRRSLGLSAPRAADPLAAPCRSRHPRLGRPPGRRGVGRRGATAGARVAPGRRVTAALAARTRSPGARRGDAAGEHRRWVRDPRAPGVGRRVGLRPAGRRGDGRPGARTAPAGRRRARAVAGRPVPRQRGRRAAAAGGGPAGRAAPGPGRVASGRPPRPRRAGRGRPRPGRTRAVPPVPRTALGPARARAVPVRSSGRGARHVATTAIPARRRPRRRPVRGGPAPGDRHPQPVRTARRPARAERRT